MDAVSDELITDGGRLEFRLFGEVELRAAGRMLDVGTPRQQVVLAALIVDAGRPVALETLVDRVWDDGPPVEARNVLYSHVSRLRQLLRHAGALAGGVSARIERRRAGYVLDVDPDLVDLYRFQRLVDQGGNPRATDVARAEVLTEALGLWRGPPLVAIPGRWVAQVRSSWQQQRMDAAVHWAQIELRLGRPTVVITTLLDLVAEYPLVEPLEGLLMRALHAAGRGAEALDRYTAIRQRLADELGADPSPELSAVHQAILRGELPPSPPANQVVAGARTVVSPAQLPPDTPGFTGRDHELHHLGELITAASDGSTAVVISAVSGTAGIGKTALAVHWAHRVRDKFPDGQLYVNLRGFDPTGSPVRPAEAIQGFLDAFEVSPERIPTSLEAQVGLYRSLIADRRVLVVLDNARDTEQVRPLLPGAPGCLVVVTSRNQLSGLVAAGAHPLTLDLLSATEARDLLAHRLGDRRITAEPDVVNEIITLCARLPLALAIVAARAALHPTFPLADLARELRQARGSLDTFAGPEPTTDARAVFSWSYLQLSPEAAQLFRLLGLHPGPDVTIPAAASLAGAPATHVRPLLAELTRTHLLTEHIPGRYTFHDLLRAYATELAHTHDADTTRHGAMQRLLGHYVHSADHADRLIDPYGDRLKPHSPPPGVGPERMADHRQALAWFDAERGVLLAAIRQLTGFDAEICELAWSIRRFLSHRGHWPDLIDALSTAANAAQRLEDPPRQAFAHRYIGCAHVLFGRYDDARTHLQHSLDLYREAGDNIGEAWTFHFLSWMLQRQDRHQEALSRYQQALRLFQSAGHLIGQARTLNGMGWSHALLGNYDDALNYCQQALDFQKELDDQLFAAQTWHSLGYAYNQLGHHTQAISCYQDAIELYHEFGDRYYEARVLVFLGDIHHAMRDTKAAAAAWQRAVDILDQLGHPDADQIRTKLNTLNDRDDPSPATPATAKVPWPVTESALDTMRSESHPTQ
jgi:DNA-binding SARP family transcriptional activator